MNRRDFLKRLGAVGLVAAAPAILTPERKYWPLDRTMIDDTRFIGSDDPAYWVQFWEPTVWEPTDTPFLDVIARLEHVDKMLRMSVA